MVTVPNIIVILLVLTCTMSCQDRNGKQSVKEQMDRIKKDTKLTFPDNSRLEHFFELERLIDPHWVAKVVVPASFYESFKQDMLSRPNDKSTLNGSLADSTSWWKPLDVILTKQYLADGHQIFVRVVVSKEDEELAVYIECVMF
jgi:hypothetical protein